MTRKLKKRLKRIIIGAAFFAAAVLIENFAPGLPWYVLLAVFFDSLCDCGRRRCEESGGQYRQGPGF